MLVKRVNSEVKHDFYDKRQTAKVKLLPSLALQLIVQ